MPSIKDAKGVDSKSSLIIPADFFSPYQKTTPPQEAAGAIKPPASAVRIYARDWFRSYIFQKIKMSDLYRIRMGFKPHSELWIKWIIYDFCVLVALLHLRYRIWVGGQYGK